MDHNPLTCADATAWTHACQATSARIHRSAAIFRVHAVDQLRNPGLARRIRALDTELAANHTALTAAVTAQTPNLLKVRGVGPVVAATVLHSWSHPGRIHSEAAFAALAGVSPLPAASSGNTRRHRLNHGGDRRLNWALYTVALTRLGRDQRTRAYLARRTAEGRTRREVIRSLKRYISRELSDS